MKKRSNYFKFSPLNSLSKNFANWNENEPDNFFSLCWKWILHFDFYLFPSSGIFQQFPQTEAPLFDAFQRYFFAVNTYKIIGYKDLMMFSAILKTYFISHNSVLSLVHGFG